MSRLRVLGYVLLGSVVTVVGMFLPLVRWVAPAIGGGVAGYAHDEGPRGGARVGVAVAAVSIAAFVAFGVLVFAALALVGMAATDPEAADAALGLGGVVAVIWVVVVPVLTLVEAPAGGLLGGHFAQRREGSDEPAGADAGDPAAAWPGVDQSERERVDDTGPSGEQATATVTTTTEPATETGARTDETAGPGRQPVELEEASGADGADPEEDGGGADPEEEDDGAGPEDRDGAESSEEEADDDRDEDRGGIQWE